MSDGFEATEARLGALIREGLAGDAASYRTLLRELGAHLRRYFLRRLGPDRAADAEDLVQETLMAVHSHRATYEPERPFTAWVHAIARYKLIDHVRRGRGRTSLPVEDAEALFAADGLFAGDETQAAMDRRDIERLLAAVPPQTRTLIRQVKLEGRSIAEVSARSGLSESAVKVGIHRGLKALAARFGGRNR
ncbi:sigma-70 family RNA polymerase sigma factor [Labrys wisconsinensis]|uniref:RNA polymerase sigma-70 factor (ECF subfamily) n=1 Tax=Labrys wisconsinensis TaxID=425677 RepID=A0ABU0JFD8_9HYPH|nr:sigma-70 family RNA polymerase sigma factor [Labrys wisconsinensis]MDQ0473002.1 RNA polymerase sigma-70 factor (ECF subfamily) [Labrys wisconsinensis]